MNGESKMTEPNQRRGRSRSSLRRSILLDHLPDAVRSKILLEFISHEALCYRGDLQSLIRLGSASKQWSQLVYRETPGLWEKIGCEKMRSMTDKQLDAFLRRTNAKEVLKTIRLDYCHGITGTGLKPLHGSTMLRIVNLQVGTFKAYKPTKGVQDAYDRGVAPDLKAIVSFVETIPPFSVASGNDPCSLETILLPAESSGGKKRWNGYKDALIGLQRMFRKINRTSTRPCPRSSCGNPSIQFWPNSRQLNEMFIATYCTKCHRLDDEDHYEEEEEIEECYKDKPDTGILDGCKGKTCKKEFDFADSTICSTCHYSWESSTCCSDCLKTGKAKMHVCNVCNATMCGDCKKYDHYLHELAIQTCQGCKVVACGICREQARCDDMYCNNHFRWWCADCPGLKACSRCERMRCEEECLASCASCGDAFCSSNDYCSRELKACVHCFRSFCRKKECANVRMCSENGCVMSVCDLCVADGKAKKMDKCKHCGNRVCDSTGCRQAHRHGHCVRGH